MIGQVWNPDTGQWEDPTESGYVPPTREDDPYAPPGYTVPSGSDVIPPPSTPDPYVAPDPTVQSPPTAPPPGGAGGGTSGGGFGGSGFTGLPTSFPNFTAPNLPSITPFSFESYRAPDPFTYPGFSAPTLQDAQ